MTVQDDITPTFCAEELKRLDHELAEATTTRRAQLDNLLPDTVEEVSSIQRAVVERALAEIDAARERIAAGTFGTCTTCAQAISPERLDFRPWSATCVCCAGR